MREPKSKKPERYVCWNMDVLVLRRHDPESNERRFQSFTPLLDAIRSKGCSNLIVTTWPRAEAEVMARAFDMEPHFDGLFGKESIAQSSLVTYAELLESNGIDARSASNRLLSICRRMEDVPLDLDIVSLIYPNLPHPALVGEMLSMLEYGDSLAGAHAALQNGHASRTTEWSSFSQIQLMGGALVDVGLAQNPLSPLQWNRIMRPSGG